MISKAEEWLVLVVSTGGHLVPTPEQLAPKNSLFLDDDGVVRDFNEMPMIKKLRLMQGIDAFGEKIKYLLENRSTVLSEYDRLITMEEELVNIDSLTVQAGDYSRPNIQRQNSGDTMQNILINLIDNDQIIKEQYIQRAEKGQVIRAAKEQSDKVYLLDELVMKLPYKHKSILQDTYYSQRIKADLQYIYEFDYSKRLNLAIRELSELFKRNVWRLDP